MAKGNEMLGYSEMNQRRVAELIGEADTLMRARAEKPEGAIGLSQSEIREYSILRALRETLNMARARQAWALPGIEGEAHRACVKKFGEPPGSNLSIYIPPEVLYRDLTAAVASGGGYLAGTTTGGSYIEMLRNRSVALRLGAQLLPGQRENLLIPRQSGAATAQWLTSEATPPTESAQTLQQIAAAPKTVAAYTEISRQLLLQSNPAAELFVTTDLAAVSAIAVDAAAIKGSGASGEPLGILGTADIGGFSGTSLGLDGLAEAQQDVLDSNAMLNPATLGYATTPTVAKLLKGRQRFTGTDSPLWRGPLHDGNVEGVRAISSKQIPAGDMIYGDWSQILIPEWGTLALEINPYANFAAAIVGVRALWSIDVVVRHAASFSVATSIT